MITIAHIHPIAVHFPIVFFLSLAAFDCAMVVLGRTISGTSCAANVSAALAALSGLTAIVAYSFGDMAYDAAIASGVAPDSLELHETIGSLTALLIVIWALVRGYVWWRRMPIEGGLRPAVAGIEIAIALLIVVTAYYGGQLVYELGVNVTRAAGV